MSAKPAAGTDLEIVSVDLCNSDHARALLVLLDDYASCQFGAGSPLPKAVTGELIERLQDCPQYIGFLAKRADQWVGLANCFTGFSTFQALPLLNVHDLCVHSSGQGQGVGRRLLGHVVESARAQGFCRVTLEVREDNEVAQRLYRSMGFQGEESGVGYEFLTLRMPETSRE